MRILYFNNPVADYLGDGILIGLLNNPEIEVWQYPVKEILYKRNKGKQIIYGNGFTMYNILEDQNIKIGNPDHELNSPDAYDLIIFPRIQMQYHLYKKYLPRIRNKKVWIFDGEDTPALYPFHGYYWRRPSLWSLPRAHTRFLYFKREWTPETIKYLNYKLLPGFFMKYFTAPENLRKISFSIPRTKIFTGLPEKTKLFPKHIVDPEVASKVIGSSTSYPFDSETDYYRDLQSSKFGITTKRSGWDCLRHYEIAANGAVICFRDLDKKPETCAPHGLINGVNCISYSSFDELDEITGTLGNEKYLELQREGYKWVNQNSCEAKALELLQNNL